MANIKLTIVGRLGKDCVVKDVNGKVVVNFSIAGETGFGENKKTIWVECSQWFADRSKTKVADYLLKGATVWVTGEPEVRTYQNNKGETVPQLAMRIDMGGLVLVSGANAGGGNAQPAQSYHTRVEPLNSEPMDDLPF